MPRFAPSQRSMITRSHNPIDWASRKKPAPACRLELTICQLSLAGFGPFFGPLYGAGSAVEFCKAQTGILLVEARVFFSQESNSDLFAQCQGFVGVATPMHTRDVSPNRNIGSQLVQLAAQCQVRSNVRHQRKAVVAGLNRIRDDESLVEQRLEQGYASPGNRRMPRSISRVSRASFRKSHWQQVSSKLREYLGHCARVQNI